MSYKKYIVRNGKVYGPYTYNSKRVDGKVVSEYHGKGGRFKFLSFSLNKKYLGMFLGVFFILAVSVLGFFFVRGMLTGYATLGLQTEYSEGEILNGVMTLNLKEGELIPATTKVIIENADRQYEFNLEDLISDEKVNGDYYIQGKEVSGGGDGYGLAGEVVSYPEVDFTLLITNSNSSEEISEAGGGSEEVGNETSSEDEISVNETIDEEPEMPANETEDSEEPVVEEETSVEEEVIEEGQEAEEEAESPSEETEEETPVEEEVAEPEQEESEEVPAGESSEEVEETPITGNVIGRIFGGISNFFLGTARMTGQVTLDISEEVSGSVAGDGEYTYEVGEGATASLKSGSVSLGNESIDDSYISVSVEDGVATVTTSYTETEETGFGENYLGEEVYELEIDLSTLDITPEEGELRLSLIYGNESIVSVTTTIDSENPIQSVSNETVSEEIVTNITVSNESELVLDYDLTSAEREALVSEFGENFTVNTTKAEIKSGRLLVRQELGKYWVENAYSISSNDVDSDTLERIELDMKRWLKNLAKSLISSSGEEEAEEVSDLITSHSV